MAIAPMLSDMAQSDVFRSACASEILPNDGLASCIVSASHIKPTFIIGPPRSGTTLLAQILARSEGVLTLSEPFLASRALRPRASRMMFQILRAYFHWRPRVPATNCPVQLFSFLRDCAQD